MKYDGEKLVSGMKELGIDLSNQQVEQFIKYYEMLMEKNRVMNLTSITDFDEVVTKHFVDSLSIVKVMDLNFPVKILDLGTGAGFPGIPMKIVFPNLDMVLMDSVNKKVEFLEEVISSLELEKVKAIHSRAEDLAHQKEYRESFDLCVSRAVANLSTLSEYCVPFIKINGSFVSYKSGEVESEIEASQKSISILGGKIMGVKKFQLPDSEISRSLIKIKKMKSTPKIYPRKSGIPNKSPL